MKTLYLSPVDVKWKWDDYETPYESWKQKADDFLINSFFKIMITFNYLLTMYLN